MRATLAVVVLVALASCGGAAPLLDSAVLADGGFVQNPAVDGGAANIPPGAGDILLYWHETRGNYCGNSLVICNGTAWWTPRQFQEKAPPYFGAGCTDTPNGANGSPGHFLFCDRGALTCTQTACGDGGIQWDCPAVPNTRSGCQWNP